MSIIKPNTKYTEVDTTSSDVEVTLSATTGLEQEYKNIGAAGYDLTITYGTDTLVLTDGQCASFTYGETVWNVFNLDTLDAEVVKITGDQAIAGKKYLADGIGLVSDRISNKEKYTSFGESITGWVTIAQVDSGNDTEATYGEVSVITDGGYVLGCEWALRPAASERSFENSSIFVKLPADLTDNFSNVVNFRLAKSDSLSTSGYKLQVYLISETGVTVQLNKNTARLSSYAGMYLLDEAIEENTPLLPDDSTATYLEAGTVYKSVTFANRGSLGNLAVRRISDDVASFHLSSKNFFSPGADIVSFDLSEATYASIFSNDGTDSIDLLTETYTTANLEVKNNEIYCQIGVVGGFAGWGVMPCDLQIKGTFKLELS